MPEAAPTPQDVRSEILRDAGLIVCAAIVLCAPRLWTHSLWSPDEARYAEVAREMRVSGNYLIPRVYGEPETSYPPLYYWLISLFSPGGVTALSATLPSLAAALGVALLTYGIGRVLWDRRSARTSALILTSTAGFVGPAILCRADMTMAFFEVSALFFFIRWYRKRESAAFPLAFYGSLAGATLAKGPQAILVVGGIVCVFLAARRELGLLGRLRTLPGLLIFFGLTLPWYVWAWKSTRQDYFLGESLSGFVGTLIAGGHSRRQILTYVPVIFLRAFPWVLFLPPALAGLRREGASGSFSLLVSWIAAVFVFYSLAAAKRHYYVTALYPALALAVGRFWTGPSAAGLVRGPLIVLASVAIGAELYLLAGPDHVGSFPLVGYRVGLQGLAAASILAGGAGLWLSACGKDRAWIAAILGGLAAAAHLGSMILYELPQNRAEQAEGARFVEILRRSISAEDRLHLYAEDVPSVPLHLDRDCRILTGRRQLQSTVATGEPFVVGVKEWRLPEVREILGPHRIVFRQEIPGGGAVLVFLRPGP